MPLGARAVAVPFEDEGGDEKGGEEQASQDGEKEDAHRVADLGK